MYYHPMFILDAESVRKARLTISLAIVNILIFILFISHSEYVYYFTQDNQAILVRFEVWRLFTAMFIHLDISHLLSNIFGLVIFGIFAETTYSKLKFITIYLISGMIGNIFSLFLLPVYAISFGASGAIFGLIGASMIIIISEHNTPLIFVGFIYLLYFIISSFMPGTNYFAHIFGLMGGLAIGFIFKNDFQSTNNYYC